MFLASLPARLLNTKVSHITDDIPVHCVVNKARILTGKHHFGGPNLIQQLLEGEGIEVVENQIQKLESHFWDPYKELEQGY